MDIKAFQDLMRAVFFHRDQARGTFGTFTWLVEEVGELAKELRKGGAGDPARHERLASEFADVLAWLCSVANLAGIDLDAAVAAKYPGACSKCGTNPCSCEP